MPIDLTTIDPVLTGKDVGLVLGLYNLGVSLDGDRDGVNKIFTFPTNTSPYFDRSCNGPPTDKDDITVYNGGVSVTIANFDPLTRKATLSTPPASGSVMTGDCSTEIEPYVAQSLDADVNYEEKTYGMLRSAVRRKVYGGRESSASLDLLMADLEGLRLFFDKSTKVMLSEPLETQAYIVLERGEAAIGRIYFPSVRIVPKKLLGAKEGDLTEYAIEMASDVDPKLWIYKA